MEDYGSSRSYSFAYYNNNNNMEIENYNGLQRPVQHSPYELRSYSESYARTQITNYYNSNKDRDFHAKKGKIDTGSGSSWSLTTDPEFQRKKRVASYKIYGVERRVKGSFGRTVRWIKRRYSQVVHGLW